MTVRNEEMKPFRDLTQEERSEIVELIANGDVVMSIFLGVFHPIRDPGVIDMNGIYRTKQRKLEIPWHVIKPEYKWAVMYSDGVICVNEIKPAGFTDAGWYGAGKCCELPLNIDTTGIDWRESLTERPEGV